MLCLKRAPQARARYLGLAPYAMNAQVKGQEGLDIGVYQQCVPAVQVGGGPTGLPVPSEHLSPPVVVSGVGGGGEQDTWRPCKEPVDSIPDRWDHGTHVHRMCGKCSVATERGTGEPEEAMPATIGVMVK